MSHDQKKTEDPNVYSAVPYFVNEEGTKNYEVGIPCHSLRGAEEAADDLLKDPKNYDGVRIVMEDPSDVSSGAIEVKCVTR